MVEISLLSGVDETKSVRGDRIWRRVIGRLKGRKTEKIVVRKKGR
jgi:hypothetical protein